MMRQVGLWALAVIFTLGAGLGDAAQAQTADDITALRARQLYVNGDFAASVKVLSPLADAGHVRAMTMLGFHYERGLGVEKDETRALALYQASADKGYACLLYTSDAADERSSVDLGGRRIIKKKTQTTSRRRGTGPVSRL